MEDNGKMSDSDYDIIRSRVNDCIRRIRMEVYVHDPDYETCADDVANKLVFLLYWMSTNRKPQELHE